MTVEYLMELDLLFCEQTSKLGASGWARFFDDEGMMLTKTGDNIIGENSIYNAMKPFFDQKGNSLTWAPESGGISEAGDLGYTYGKYLRKRFVDGDIITDTGRYLTIWRQIDSKTYKIELDMGN